MTGGQNDTVDASGLGFFAGTAGPTGSTTSTHAGSGLCEDWLAATLCGQPGCRNGPSLQAERRLSSLGHRPLPLHLQPHLYPDIGPRLTASTIASLGPATRSGEVGGDSGGAGGSADSSIGSGGHGQFSSLAPVSPGSRQHAFYSNASVSSNELADTMAIASAAAALDAGTTSILPNIASETRLHLSRTPPGRVRSATWSTASGRFRGRRLARTGNNSLSGVYSAGEASFERDEQLAEAMEPELIEREMVACDSRNERAEEEEERLEEQNQDADEAERDNLEDDEDGDESCMRGTSASTRNDSLWRNLEPSHNISLRHASRWSLRSSSEARYSRGAIITPSPTIRRNSASWGVPRRSWGMASAAPAQHGRIRSRCVGSNDTSRAQSRGRAISHVSATQQPQPSSDVPRSGDSDDSFLPDIILSVESLIVHNTVTGILTEERAHSRSPFSTNNRLQTALRVSPGDDDDIIEEEEEEDFSRETEDAEEEIADIDGDGMLGEETEDFYNDYYRSSGSLSGRRNLSEQRSRARNRTRASRAQYHSHLEMPRSSLSPAVTNTHLLASPTVASSSTLETSLCQDRRWRGGNPQIRDGITRFNTDVSAPGAIIALGLAYLGTDHPGVSQCLMPPDSLRQFDSVRPDLLRLRAVAHGLVTWQTIRPTRAWLQARLPTCLTNGLLNYLRRYSSSMMVAASATTAKSNLIDSGDDENIENRCPGSIVLSSNVGAAAWPTGRKEHGDGLFKNPLSEPNLSLAIGGEDVEIIL
ncbi:unnamed protein product [Protopolystoma xenopodis]|uniref:Uncharacterized protein n=1 Tax=Protopolystoma xenopodis TaxID=117903 RepID=A0A448WDT8_9PLAT|nr:unnamed protein product [Protopolystoma xenopodis]